VWEESVIRVDIQGLRVVSTMNEREHWRKRAKRSREQRRFVAMLACGRFGDLQPPLRGYIYRSQVDRRWKLMSDASLSVTLTRIAPRALDGDNLAAGLKAVRDGVADALGVNDADPRVTWAYAQERGKPREYAVRIEIRADASRTQSDGVNADVNGERSPR